MDLIIKTLYLVADIYQYCILFWVISSWFPALQESSAGQLIGKIVEPWLKIFRKITPSLGPIDISPIVAMFAFSILSHWAILGIVELISFFYSNILAIF